MEPATTVIHAPPPRESSLMLVSTLLAWVCMFLMGYLVSGWWSNADRQLIIEGTVAHFGALKLMRIGWEEELQDADDRLRAIAPEVKKLSEEHAKAAGDGGADVAKRWRVVRELLAESQQKVADVQKRYGLSNEERMALAMLESIKQEELTSHRRRTSPSVDDVLPDRSATSKERQEPTRSAPVKGKSDVPAKKPDTKPPESKPKPQPPEQGAALPNGKLK